MKLTKEQKAKIFDRIFQEYVSEHGLGGMSKSDLDSLILWLVVNEQEEVNAFDLSNTFKITESRIKSLLETAAVKFDSTKPYEAWLKILTIFSKVEFDIESLEKGQVRFQLKNPMLYRWLQEQVRSLKSTCSYHKPSEQVTLNLDILYKIFDELWEENSLGENWRGENLNQAREKIKLAVGMVGKKIEGNCLEELREMKKPKLRSIIENATLLKGIGDLALPLWDKISS